MDANDINEICMGFPSVKAELKWKSDLVFSVKKKIFCIVDLEGPPHAVSFKVPEDEFEEICSRLHFRSAPYFGRYSWVMIEDMNKMGISAWHQALQTAYELVVSKLSARAKSELVRDQQ